MFATSAGCASQVGLGNELRVPGRKREREGERERERDRDSNSHSIRLFIGAAKSHEDQPVGREK